MKRTETERAYHYSWDVDEGQVYLQPGIGEAHLTRQGFRDTDCVDTMSFSHPDQLEAFASELVKVAGEMRKWPEFKSSAKGSK